jgi:hypothetical protein
MQAVFRIFPLKSLPFSYFLITFAKHCGFCQRAINHVTPMMDTIAKLREKYDLHMTVERYTAAGMQESENQFIRK